MPNYARVLEAFQVRGCQLLSTKEEVEQNMADNPKYRYIAKCAHEHVVFYNVFVGKRATGHVCPKCVIKESSQKGTIRMKDDKTKGIKLEKKCMDYFIEMVKEEFTCTKAFDGCRADMMLKPISNQNDEWIGIQVKSTSVSQMGYGFNLAKKNYENMLILCICDLDSRMWLIPHENVKHLRKLGIGKEDSKYDHFEITKDNWATKITEYYRSLPKLPFETLDTPQCIYTQREKSYRLKREQHVPFLEYVYPNIEGQVVDFMCNGYKVQEKVGGRCKSRNGFHFTLCKNNGRKGGKQAFTSYDTGDNDRYWLHCDKSPYFYVFPESRLIKMDYVNTYGGTTLFLTPEKKDEWYSPYRFDYDNLDKEKLEKMFHKH